MDIKIQNIRLDKWLFKEIRFLFQVADVVLHESQTFDLSMVLHLVTILCDRASYEPKGFMCIVCHLLVFLLLIMFSYVK